LITSLTNQMNVLLNLFMGSVGGSAAVVSLIPTPQDSTDRDRAVKLQINSERCQGHGRCYDLAPDLFGDDEEGFGRVLGDGVVSPDKESDARLAVANCPERAVEILEEG
jgi:ferredoxin